MTARIARLLILALMATIFIVPGRAVAQLERERLDFTLGNIVFAILHEFAHAVIEDHDIPVLGNSEDAADTLAAITMIRRDQAGAEDNFALRRWLLTAVDANRILWLRGVELGNPIVFLARHPLTVQRAARVTCLVYGSDTTRLALIPQLTGLPDFRADWCDQEYRDAEGAWVWVRDTYLSNVSKEERNHQVSYGKARGEQQEIMLAKMREFMLLENIIEQVGPTVLLNSSILLRTKSCGSPDAYWDGESREIVLCYELVEVFYNLAAEQKVQDWVNIFRESSL